MLTRPQAQLLKEFLEQPQVVVHVHQREKLKLLLEIFDELERVIALPDPVKK